MIPLFNIVISDVSRVILLPAQHVVLEELNTPSSSILKC